MVLVDVHKRYNAMDWLLERQNHLKNKLAKKHLKGGSLVLFDGSSSGSTGRKSSLHRYGVRRDHRTDRPQITYGLLCAAEGRPISVEVLPGNTADPNAFNSLVQQARRRFEITHVNFVGERGMIISKRINEDSNDVDGLHWIFLLRTEGVCSLVEAGKVQRSLFPAR